MPESAGERNVPLYFERRGSQATLQGGGERMKLNAVSEVDRIATNLRHQVGMMLHRRGLVVAMSGGVDSSLCAALAVRAIGPARVLGLALPEPESDPISEELAAELAGQLGIELLVESIGPILEACGCYARRDAAIRRLIPEYSADWRVRVVLGGNPLSGEQLNVSYLEALSSGGERRRVRIPAPEYREIVAATNYKQRVRKMIEYYHADRLHYAVVGTPNRVEFDQGFFVKGGDGLADVKPIAHLYKTQVYELARSLGLPQRIIDRPPTTDTYSLPQTQEEFFFSMPAEVLDHLVEAGERNADTATVARELGLSQAAVERAFKDIRQKRETTRYLHLPPLLIEDLGVPGSN